MTEVALVLPHKKKKKKKIWVPGRTFSENYELTDKILGSGTYSVVRQARHVLNGEMFAVKCIDKSSHDYLDELVTRELAILKKCCHRNCHANVVKFVESYESDDEVHIVFELVEGGALFDRLATGAAISERDAAEIIREIASALAYVHSLGVAHRDLKPANILCARLNSLTPVKIADFGLASTLGTVTTPPLHTPVGTAEFQAPEVIGAYLNQRDAYDKKCDVWSLGVIGYLLLCGELPFSASCGRDCGWASGEACQACHELLMEAIQEGEVRFDGPPWKSVSSDAKSLLQAMLATDTNERLSATEVLDHEWLHSEQPSTTPLRRRTSINNIQQFFNQASAAHRSASIDGVAQLLRGAESDTSKPAWSPTISRSGPSLDDIKQIAVKVAAHGHPPAAFLSRSPPVPRAPPWPRAHVAPAIPPRGDDHCFATGSLSAPSLWLPGMAIPLRDAHHSPPPHSKPATSSLRSPTAAGSELRSPTALSELRSPTASELRSPSGSELRSPLADLRSPTASDCGGGGGGGSSGRGGVFVTHNAHTAHTADDERPRRRTGSGAAMSATPMIVCYGADAAQLQDAQPVLLVD